MRGDVSFMQQTRNHMTAFTSARRTGWGPLLAGPPRVRASPHPPQPPPPPPPPPPPAGSVPAPPPHTTAQQRATAQQVAEHGVPLQELAPGAPDSYSVKRGDTL